MWGSALRSHRRGMPASKTRGSRPNTDFRCAVPAGGIKGESLQLFQRAAQSEMHCVPSTPSGKPVAVSCRSVLPAVLSDARNSPSDPRGPTYSDTSRQSSVECRLRSLLAKHGYLVRFSSLLGKGEYAVIRSAIKTKVSPKKECAVKIINRDMVPTEYAEKFIPRELSMVKVLKHQSIVSVYDIIEIGQYIFIFMEDAKLGDLSSVLRKRGTFSPQQAKYIITTLIRALHYCHVHGVAHRSLSCENILCFPGKYLTVKIGDFSNSRYCRDLTTNQKKLSDTYCGSPGNIAPEILWRNSYNPLMVDVWNLGAIAFTLLTGEVAFSFTDLAKIRQDDHKVKDWAMRKLYEYLEEFGGECADLVTSMLNLDVVCRPTLGMVAKHPWLTNRTIPKSISIKVRSEGDIQNKEAPSKAVKKSSVL